MSSANHALFLLQLKKDLRYLKQMMQNLDRRSSRQSLLIKMEKRGSVERNGGKFNEVETEEEIGILKKACIVVRYIGEIKYTINELEILIKFGRAREFDLNAAKQNRDSMMQKLQIGA